MAEKRGEQHTEGMRDGGKFEEPEWEGEGLPGEGAEGFTKYPVGDQDNAEAGAGEEGAHALEEQLKNGMADSHERFSDPMRSGPTGMEK
jgi:hypothetical protein